MKVNIRELNEESFKRIKNNVIKNYSREVNQQDINNLLIECINLHKKRGYTDEQIQQMTFTISYYHHQ
ncbi:hypothetical protein [Aliarcobacter butzleri]|uniref:hypothetical protein n=1 Tax=Aliarcobacter butzleri TaxID=28197 RepID=UPI002B244CD2|nr:hypothetical protein [Aliarcobacter butzleri]